MVSSSCFSFVALGDGVTGNRLDSELDAGAFFDLAGINTGDGVTGNGLDLELDAGAFLDSAGDNIINCFFLIYNVTHHIHYVENSKKASGLCQ